MRRAQTRVKGESALKGLQTPSLGLALGTLCSLLENHFASPSLLLPPVMGEPLSWGCHGDECDADQVPCREPSTEGPLREVKEEKRGEHSLGGEVPLKIPGLAPLDPGSRQTGRPAPGLSGVGGGPRPMQVGGVACWRPAVLCP